MFLSHPVSFEVRNKVRYVCSLCKQEILPPCDLDFIGDVSNRGGGEKKRRREWRREGEKACSFRSSRLTNGADAHLCPAPFAFFPPPPFFFLLPLTCPSPPLPARFYVLSSWHAVARSPSCLAYPYTIHTFSDSSIPISPPPPSRLPLAVASNRTRGKIL